MNKTARLLIALSFSLALAVPSYSRGFGGGFGGRGGFDRGGFDRGGFGHSDFDRSGFDHNFDRGAIDHPAGAEGLGYGGAGAHSYGEMGGAGFPRGAYGGGGFSSIAGERPGSVNSAGLASQSRFAQFSGHNPSQLASEGGLGSVAGRQGQFNNQHFQNVDSNRINAEGGNTINNTNNINRGNISTGYHPNGAYGDHPYGGAYGYHPYGGAYGYHHYGAYGYHPYGGLYGYPGGWCDAGFMEASMWTCMGVSSLTSFLGIAALSGSSKPASTNITYQGDSVYVNGQPASQYYQQGQQLAQSAATNPSYMQQYSNSTTTPFNQQLAYNPDAAGQIPNQGLVANAPTQTWEPLGVYALTEPGQSQSTMLFQLAINKDGQIGNYLNQITNEKAQIHGALDKNSQQISWSVGNNAETVFDTSLNELMKDDSKVVVQFGPDNIQKMQLVRQKAPKQDANAAEAPTS